MIPANFPRYITGLGTGNAKRCFIIDDLCSILQATLISKTIKNGRKNEATSPRFLLKSSGFIILLLRRFNQKSVTNNTVPAGYSKVSQVANVPRSLTISVATTRAKEISNFFTIRYFHLKDVEMKLQALMIPFRQNIHQADFRLTYVLLWLFHLY
jgi:hypothetical protein